MRIYLKLLAFLYAIGFILHLLDLFDLRLIYTDMNTTWKFWTVYLLVFDGLAAIFLWLNKIIGEYLFILIACSQLAAYILFRNIFGEQNILILFHIVCLLTYILFKYKNKSTSRA